MLFGHISIVFTTLCVVLDGVAAYTVEGILSIPAAANETHPRSPSVYRIALNGGQQIAIPREDGFFKFSSLQAGSYDIDVLGIDFVFPKFIVDVKHNSRVNTIFHVTPQNEVNRYESSPFVIRPLSFAVYYSPPKPFDFSQFYKNPMIIMFGVMMFLMVILPKLTDSAEFEQAQQEVQGAVNPQVRGANPGRSRPNKKRR